jgi:hypothetical protein
LRPGRSGRRAHEHRASPDGLDSMSLLPSVVVDPVNTEAAADFAGGQIPRLDRPVYRVGREPFECRNLLWFQRRGQGGRWLIGKMCLGSSREIKKRCRIPPPGRQWRNLSHPAAGCGPAARRYTRPAPCLGRSRSAIVRLLARPARRTPTGPPRPSPQRARRPGRRCRRAALRCTTRAAAQRQPQRSHRDTLAPSLAPRSPPSRRAGGRRCAFTRTPPPWSTR